MSDFSDVEFFDNLEEQSTGTPVAPEGEYNARLLILTNTNLQQETGL